MLGSAERTFGQQALRRCALFRHVDATTLTTLFESMRRRRFKRDQVIFYEGDPGGSLFVIESGLVKIALGSRDDDEEQAIIATLRPGDFFGELALLDGAPHSATAIALEPTDTLVLQRDPFLRLIDTDASLRRVLLEALTAELRRLTGHVQELHFLDLSGRLAMRLSRMAAETAPGARTEVHLDWPYTQAELAAMIGGTRQSVNRLLADLAARDIIRIEHGTLLIPDVARLEREAER